MSIQFLIRELERASLMFAAAGLVAVLLTTLHLIEGVALRPSDVAAIVGLPYAIAVAEAVHRRRSWVAARWPHALLCCLAVVAVAFRARDSTSRWVLSLSLLLLIVLYAFSARGLGRAKVRPHFLTLEPSAPDWFEGLFTPRVFLAACLVVVGVHYAVQPTIPLLKSLPFGVQFAARCAGALLTVGVVWLAAHVLLRGDLPEDFKEIFQPDGD